MKPRFNHLRIIVFLIILCHQTLILKSQIPDTVHLKFCMGSNFDFLDNNISFKKVYGELKYTNDKIINIHDSLYFGLDVGGYKNQTVSTLDNNYISYRSYIDPINPYFTPDTMRVISQTIKSRQALNFSQLSLYVNPMVTWSFVTTDTNRIAFRVGIGPYFEMYRTTSYIKYYDTSVLRQDTGKVPKTFKFVPTNFLDSVGSTNTFGYLGINLSLMLYTAKAIVKVKGVFGKVVINDDVDNEYSPTSKIYSAKSKGFYFVDACITEPHSKISVHGNIRGLFPNHTPVVGIFVTKTFDIAKIYEALTQ